MVIRRPAVIVLAKAPRPGISKTRLTPPLSPVEAAAVAEASLGDTLGTVMEVARALPIRPLLALDGPRGPWIPSDMSVLSQRGRGLDERLAATFAEAGGPAVLIGMDTPQVSPGLLVDALDALLEPGMDSVLGSAVDGGWWSLGLRRPDPRVFLGVPMSLAATGAQQRHRLALLGLRVASLPVLRDVDTFDDALRVAEEVPASRFERTIRRVSASLEGIPS